MSSYLVPRLRKVTSMSRLEFKQRLESEMVLLSAAELSEIADNKIAYSEKGHVNIL